MAYDENTDRSPDYWRERCEKIEKLLNHDSTQLIGSCRETFKEFERKEWDWKSYYNGWLNGRVDIMLRYRKLIKELEG